MVRTQCLISHLHEPTLQAAIRSAADEFESVSYMHGRRGVQVTRNKLLAQSKSEYVSYLDADDYRLLGRLDSQLQRLVKSGADCCYAPNQHRCMSDDPIMAIITSRMNPAGLWRRTSLLRIGERFGEVWDTSYEACTDAIVYLRALQCGLKLVYSPLPVIYYRPGGQLTADKRRWATYKLKLLDEVEAWLGAGNSYRVQIANERAIANQLYAFHDLRCR